MPNNSNKLDFTKASGQALQKLAGAASASAAAPVWWTGFENGALSINGTGLFSGIDGTAGTTVSVTNTQANSGTFSLRTNPTATVAGRVRRTIAGSPTVYVVRHYFRIATAPTSAGYIAEMDAAVSSTNPRIYLNPTGSAIEMRAGSTLVAQIGTYSLNTWFYVDWRVDVSANPWQFIGSVNGGADASGISAQAADTFTEYRAGTGSTTGPAFDVYHDDILISVTNGDYPLGAGGTESAVPNADGTHNAGTNIMEDNAGADIGVVAAWSLLDEAQQTSTTDFVRQAATGTTNYAEVLFGDPSHTTNIYGVRVILAYMSAGTASNQGATIVSYDNFSSFQEVYGNPTTRQDMSEASLFYKTLFMTEPAGGWDSATLNALRARIGYSGDASPIPQWHGLMLEIAYSSQTALTINKSESITLTENVGAFVPGGGILLDIIEGESVTVAESVSLTMSTPQASTSDAVAVAENRSLTVGTSQVNKSDAVSVAESVTVAIAAVATLAVNKSDAITITESRSVTVDPPPVSASDSVTVSENIALFVASAGSLSVSVSDSVTVSESKAANINFEIATSDAVLVSENWLTVVQVLINKSESISVAESKSVTVSAATTLNINKSDSITVTESKSVNMTRGVTVSDSITVEDNGYAPPVVDTGGNLALSRSDAVSLAESVSLAIVSVDVSASDAVTIAESVSLAVSTSQISVSDAVTVTESYSTAIVTAISVSDAVTLTENIRGYMSTAGFTLLEEIQQYHSHLDEIPLHRSELSETVLYNTELSEE